MYALRLFCKWIRVTYLINTNVGCKWTCSIFQGDDIDRIDTNIEMAVSSAETARKETADALRKQKSARRVSFCYKFIVRWTVLFKNVFYFWF